VCLVLQLAMRRRDSASGMLLQLYVMSALALTSPDLSMRYTPSRVSSMR
jgi:hypothetical protein